MQQKSNLYFAAILFILFAAGCAKRPPEPPTLKIEKDPVYELRMQLDRVLNDPNFENAFWGVAIQSLQNGQMLYEHNLGKLLMPASNMKLITAAAALKKFGPEFRYETQLFTDGEIDQGTLTGNLIIQGSGDPTISARFGEGDHFRVFADWSSRLRSMGITSIAGDIIGMDDAFDDQRIGYGWSWDDLPYYYATEVDALQFAENAITVTIEALENGQNIRVRKDPDTTYVTVVHEIQIVESTEPHVDWRYESETRTVYATGTLPAGGQDYGSFSIRNPAAYFAHALKEALDRNGIAVQGTAYRAGDRLDQALIPGKLLLSHPSPPLREIISIVLKNSQNLYAETLLKTLGAGTSQKGIQEIVQILTQMEISPQNFIITDGSGLSRYNYVTPRGLLQLLQIMFTDSDFEAFYQALAIAGVDGTLRSRMKGTSAENNVHAKTGSLSNVRALSGYARTRDGEMLAFVLITNNFSAANETVQNAQDAILQQLTSFTRK